VPRAALRPKVFEEGKKRLRPIERALADPRNPSIQIAHQHGQPEEGYQFADRIERVRRALADLKSGRRGGELVSGIQSAADLSDAGGKWGSGAAARARPGVERSFAERWEQNAEALSHVSIYAPDPGAPASKRNFAQAYGGEARAGGERGSGSKTRITFDDNAYNVLAPFGNAQVPVLRGRENSFNPDALDPGLRELPPSVVLGHELVHAYRHARGIAVKNYPDLKTQASEGKRSKDKKRHEDNLKEYEVRKLQEEFETVGLLRPPSKRWSHTTENDLRKDYNERVKRGKRDAKGKRLLGPIRPRKDYSGRKPRLQREMLASLPRERRREINEDFRK